MKTASFILCTICMLACEQTIQNPDWPEHDEKFVVTGYVRIQDDSLFSFCRVTRTLPLRSSMYNPDEATVDDATVELRSSMENIPFQHHPGGVKMYNYTAVAANSGASSYTIHVEGSHRTARATVDVDDLPLYFEQSTIERYDATGYILQAVMPSEFVAGDYDMILEILPPGGHYWIEQTFRHDVSLYYDAVIKRFRLIVYFYFEADKVHWKKRYKLIARSREYDDYRHAIYSGWNSGGPFEGEMKNPPFNVTGNGIGFFWYERVGEPVEF